MPNDLCELTFRQELVALKSVLDKKTAQIDEWGAWFDRCTNKLSIGTRERWNYVNQTPKQWKESLQAAKFNKNYVDQLITIIDKRESQRLKITKLRTIIEKILNFTPSGNKGKDLLTLQSFKRDLERLPKGIIKLFGELLLAKEVENKAVMKKVMERMIHWEFRAIPFYGIDLPLSEQTWSSIDKLLVEASTVLGDPILIRAFATRVFQFIEPTKLPQFNSKADTNWTLNELRKLAESPWYSIRYPAFIFNQLNGRVSQAEIASVVEALAKRLTPEKWNINDLWIFSDWLPNNDELRSKVVAAVKNISKKDELYLRELLIRLSENVVLRKELEKNGVIESKALFKLKRDFYLRLLNDGAQVEYALYQLIAIGDEDRDYLWWLVFNPFLNQESLN